MAPRNSFGAGVGSDVEVVGVDVSGKIRGRWPGVRSRYGRARLRRELWAVVGYKYRAPPINKNEQ